MVAEVVTDDGTWQSSDGLLVGVKGEGKKGVTAWAEVVAGDEWKVRGTCLRGCTPQAVLALVAPVRSGGS
jgi:hypothetical protein